ncbi:MAG: hypothetical protein HQL13_03740 [Candidatus Omnitrophica bacterium]|nr:hypothetical protein [Candidatus Omnitrophota bacterium]
MNNLLIIACGMGLQDGFNPCVFTATVVFISLGLWFSESLKISSIRVIFALTYCLGVLFFNFGPAQILLLTKNFIFVAKIFYLLTGGVAFIAGVLFFKDWVIHREEDCKIKAVHWPGLLVGSMVGFFALIFSLFATVWPINKYLVLLGFAAILKGQWLMGLPLVMIYVWASLWPVWLIWGVLCIKNLRVSFFKIFCSAIFFTASSSMILIFK